MVRAHIVGSSQILAHVPDLVLSGSKPAREIATAPEVRDHIGVALRSLEAASSYVPNRVFIGAENPRPLTEPGTPWWNSSAGEGRAGLDGVLFSQDEFLHALKAVDSVGLVSLSKEPLIDTATSTGAIAASLSVSRGNSELATEAVKIPARHGFLGTVSWGYPGDDALSPPIVLENLATKASAALALRHALEKSGFDPGRLDFVVSCSEEAVGDRYQRGGGNLGKAVAEVVGAGRSSGFDVKNFCAAPIPALVVASSLIEAGVANSIAVVAGGSLPKLGMKFQGHLKNEMPVLEDCLGAVAVILTADQDGPILRHDAVGRHSVQAGGSNPQVFGELVFDPLERIGVKVLDVSVFGTELHNPELTEPQGSGNVPLRNYRLIAALAAQRQHISASDMDEFLSRHCFAGFAPTQGHIASAICLLPYIRRQMDSGGMARAQLIAKGSLFLGRMSAMSDGMSIIVEP